jgi:hypothetical protein
MTLAFDMEHDFWQPSSMEALHHDSMNNDSCTPLFHIAYIAIGLGVQQGGQQHRFTLIL